MTLRLGTSRCCGCGPKKTRKETNKKVQGEAVSAEMEGTGSRHYPGDPAKTINEGGYAKQHICNVDENSLTLGKDTI